MSIVAQSAQAPSDVNLVVDCSSLAVLDLKNAALRLMHRRGENVPLTPATLVNRVSSPSVLMTWFGPVTTSRDALSFETKPCEHSLLSFFAK